ncbi:MAG: hypothetical protein RLZZ450_4723 [Pseudomonadota bacterium]
MKKARPGDGRFTELRVGVIGEAGVGKSTLINALLSERLPILPQGGVGPLTATPIEVRYSSQPYVRVACLGSARVRQLIEAVATNSMAPQIQDADRPRLRAWRQLARLLVGASQFADLDSPAMLAFLFSCLSGEIDERVAAVHFDRLLAAQSVVARGDSEAPTLEVIAGVDLPAMLSTLSTHAAGFLAPLTSSLVIGWDAALLREEIVLIDLPGLGVANDEYRNRTSSALQGLDALLWVVDRSGLTQASADLLQSTQFLARMLEESRERRPATLELAIAVTKLDQPVSDAVLAGKQSGAERVSWTEAAATCAARARDVLRSQFDMELARSLQPDDEVFGERVSARLGIFPVFPREYQRLYRADPDEPTSLREADASGVPKLAARLAQIGRAHKVDLVHACRRALPALKQGPARAEAEVLNLELRDLMKPRAG